MHIITFASQKGGVGKTTLCGHLAVEAERRGAGPVALVDTDPQHSLKDWWDARADIPHTPALVLLDTRSLKDGLAQLRRQKIALVLIDTRSAVSEDIRTIVQASDLVIIPSRPSPLDLRAVGPTLALVEQAGKPWIFVLNAAVPRARVTQEVAAALAEEGKVAKTVLHSRGEIAAAMGDGRTAREINETGKSAAEIADLWTYINRQLNRMRRTA